MKTGVMRIITATTSSALFCALQYLYSMQIQAVVFFLSWYNENKIVVIVQQINSMLLKSYKNSTSKTFLRIADRPDTPTITNTETTVTGCNVTIKWNKPSSNGCPILFFTVHYKQKAPPYGDLDWSIVNVTDPGVNHQALVLNCSTTYEFEVKAWNEIGCSHSPLKAWPIRTGGGQTVAQRDLRYTSDSGIFNSYSTSATWI